jgi:hypothetical protein
MHCSKNFNCMYLQISAVGRVRFLLLRKCHFSHYSPVTNFFLAQQYTFVLQSLSTRLQPNKNVCCLVLLVAVLIQSVWKGQWSLWSGLCSSRKLGRPYWGSYLDTACRSSCFHTVKYAYMWWQYINAFAIFMSGLDDVILKWCGNCRLYTQVCVTVKYVAEMINKTGYVT